MTDRRRIAGTAGKLLTPVLVSLGLGLAACDDQGKTAADAPYLEITGGGFVFNYRVADAYYGFVARPLRSLPEGASLEARFEDPAGGPRYLERQPAAENALRYSFRSPPLQGIEADRPYAVELRLIAADRKTVLQSLTRTYTSQLDQEVNPEKPLTVGPGYHKNSDPD
ncbi:hypothetical protein [Pelagibius sp.]|uniref:hypothetical protein n=1 Tax=Pelagibius sp. TaxID=1931238 RepID=UPI002614A093|nr:hypothetical protein [Pelagibius sp.]